VLGFLQLLLLQTAGLPGRLDNPFVGMLWTLCVEMQFYLVFPFLLRCYERRGVSFAVMLIAAFTVMRLMTFLLTGTLRDTTYFSIIGRMDQFMVGLLAGAAYNRFRSVRTHTPILFVAALALALGYVTVLNKNGGWAVDGMFWIVWPWWEGLVCAALLLTYLSFSAFVPSIVSRLLTAMGTVSYSTYLLHFPILVALIHAKLVIRFPERTFDPALLNTVILLVPLTYAVSTITYLGIERPFFQFRRKYVGAPSAVTRTEGATA
jgi:peptidoglycan/LPS O-acetylase OafA/YrhL